jgi:carbamate kinase
MARPQTLVIALGGNALIKPGQRGFLKEQLANLDKAMEAIAGLSRRNRIVLTHGNGPQVGDILLQQELGKGKAPEMPLQACVAESQGLIGFMIQDVLYGKLHEKGIDKPVVTLVTQVLVDQEDPAFKKPSKPIGPCYKNERHLPIHWHITETPRGFRRVVPSPLPRKILEAEAIERLSRDSIVIACGGGGIPVARTKKGLRGLEAVIDKDLTAALLARAVKADTLAILTNVPHVYLNYGKESQRALRNMTLENAKSFLKKGHFPPGTMGPKIRASIAFLKASRKGRVIVAGLDRLEKALKGESGTVIIKEAK